MNNEFFSVNPVEIRVRPSVPTERLRLSGAVLPTRPLKHTCKPLLTAARYRPCSMVKSAEHWPKFYNPLPAMMTSPYE